MLLGTRGKPNNQAISQQSCRAEFKNGRQGMRVDSLLDIEAVRDENESLIRQEQPTTHRFPTPTMICGSPLENRLPLLQSRSTQLNLQTFVYCDSTDFSTLPSDPVPAHEPS
ncbi:hypothetical protein ACNTMW_19435 [Planosporangium sp. 12N6]|uniref:hypothetical protein n=1 Tax=Planosporangium spinosum TaxID=3402278 RepID=UPI003CEA2164